MAPNLEVTADLPNANNNDDVVISGISGRFPHCKTFEEFKQKLFNGTDILTEGESRWPDGKILFDYNSICNILIIID